MAIKRSSKSRGTPVRQPVTSPGLRHVEVRVPHQMVAGDVYIGWVCKNKSCGLVIAVALTPAGSKPALAESDDQLAVIKCPHCGDEDPKHILRRQLVRSAQAWLTTFGWHLSVDAHGADGSQRTVTRRYLSTAVAAAP